MKILALDSSGLVASAAIVEDDVLIAEYTTDYKKTHSQTLLPMLDEIRQMIDLDLHTIDAIAISAGPGSFTGLRIGAATAKGLGLALNLPLVEVPTLEGLAFNLWGTDKLVCPIMDARRNQVYTGIYEFCREEISEKESSEHQLVMHSIKEQCAIAVDELVEELNRLVSSLAVLDRRSRAMQPNPHFRQFPLRMDAVPLSIHLSACQRELLGLQSFRYKAQPIVCMRHSVASPTAHKSSLLAPVLENAASYQYDRHPCESALTAEF